MDECCRADRRRSRLTLNRTVEWRGRLRSSAPPLTANAAYRPQRVASLLADELRVFGTRLCAPARVRQRRAEIAELCGHELSARKSDEFPRIEPVLRSFRLVQALQFGFKQHGGDPFQQVGSMQIARVPVCDKGLHKR